MAFKTLAVAVTDVAAQALAVGTSANGFPTGKFLVRNTGTETVFVGGSDVTSANGMTIKADELMAVSSVAPHDYLYAVCAAGKASTLRFLWTAPN